MGPGRFTGADGAVQQLEAHGVSAVFGIPGVHNLALFEALERSSIRTVLVRHEQTAVYAADSLARATGRIGVAVTTTGPGAANTAAAMGEARASRSPVLHISTQLPTRVLDARSGRGSLHESPQQRELMAAVATWSERVATAEAIPQLIAKAIGAAYAGRRGPAFLEIPFDLLEQPIARRPAGSRRSAGLEPDTKQLRRGAALLRKAERPVIWAGGGAVDAAEAVGAVAETLDAPVVTTFAGRGVLPGSHPLAVTLPAAEPKVTELIEKSDAVLVVGSDLDASMTMGWRIGFPRPRISINTVADDARRNYAADVVIDADARASLEALLPMLAAQGPRRRRSAARRVQSARSAAIKRIESSALAPGFAFACSVEAAAAASDAVVVCDMSIPAYWVGAYSRFERPRRLQYPLGWGTLGWGIPAAVGAGIAGQRVIVVSGDAGAMFGIGELATYVQEGLDVCVLVVNDRGYGMLRVDTEQRFGKRFADQLVVPDLVTLADAFGIPARRARIAGLDAALRWGLKQSGPSLIEVRASFEPPASSSPRWFRRGEPERRP